MRKHLSLENNLLQYDANIDLHRRCFQNTINKFICRINVVDDAHEGYGGMN